MEKSRKYILDFIKRFENNLKRLFKKNIFLSLFIIIICLYFIFTGNKVFIPFFNISLILGGIGSIVIVKDKKDNTLYPIL